jgi:hypothetical protein
MSGNTYVHSIATGRLLASVTLSKSPVQGVGESVLLEVGQLGIIDLEGGEVGRVDDGLNRVGIDDGSLVRLGIDELVVDDLDAVVLLWESGDLVGDQRSVGEGRDGLSDTSEVDLDVLGVRTRHLRLGLLTNNDEVGIGVGGEHATGVLAESGVDSTAKTFVGAGNDNQSLLVALLGNLGLSLLEDGVRGLSVCSGVLHSACRSVQLGRGNNLHGVGDLLDVADRLETVLNLTKSREGGGIGSNGAIGGELLA